MRELRSAFAGGLNSLGRASVSARRSGRASFPALLTVSGDHRRRAGTLAPQTSHDLPPYSDHTHCGYGPGQSLIRRGGRVPAGRSHVSRLGADAMSCFFVGRLVRVEDRPKLDITDRARSLPNPHKAGRFRAVLASPQCAGRCKRGNPLGVPFLPLRSVGRERLRQR
jgi:hypothetical protein